MTPHFRYRQRVKTGFVDSGKVKNPAECILGMKAVGSAPTKNNRPAQISADNEYALLLCLIYTKYHIDIICYLPWIHRKSH